MSLVLDGTNGITAPDGETFPESLINNSSASSDISLAIGQGCYINVAGATTVPLHVACGDGQEYEITGALEGNIGSTSNTLLLPNNTTYTNKFLTPGTASGGAIGGSYTSGFLIAYYQDIRSFFCKVFTSTVSKSVLSMSGGFDNSSQYFAALFSTWQATASNGGAGDTTTLWTSLATLVFPVAVTGRIIIRRIA